MRISPPPGWLAAIAAALWLAAGPAMAADPGSIPVPDAMANQPNARDFVTKSDTNLSFSNNPLRFGGVNVRWLGIIGTASHRPDARTPTDYEINDVFATAQAMGVGYIRATSLLASAGCALCLVSQAGVANAAAITYIDHVLKMARDAGIRLVLPLAGGGQCGNDTTLADTQCAFADARSLPVAEFYRDAGVREDFFGHVIALLRHVNPQTGLAWKDDATIVAWENCDGCGAGLDPGAIAEWTEALGRAIKSVDHFHLYENGAFAGRLGGLDPARLSSPSVDILGDRVAPEAGAAPDGFANAQAAANKAGLVYVIDSYAWTPSHWTTQNDFESFLGAVVENRAVAGAFLNDLGAHADGGGWLAPIPASDPELYFPGAPEGGIDLPTMTPRARAVRRFDYKMMDLDVPAFRTPDPPEIISVRHGRIVWRGSAGAVNYSLSRSTDLTLEGSWQTLCDQCVTDAEPGWQDPAVPAGNVWYRITPYNANLHGGLPSAPFQNENP